MRAKFYLSYLVLVWGLGGCMSSRNGQADRSLISSATERSAALVTVAQNAGIASPAVIAHRGASYDAPESTEIAYLLARSMGADYLEADLQRTSDGQLVLVHDETLQRTSNVSTLFPDRVHARVTNFTLAELKQLDVGSWFNKAFPTRARAAFAGAKIITLDELINIAEGKRADGSFDAKDSGNRPGIYLETKAPQFYPGIEQQLAQELRRRGWLAPYDTDRVKPPKNRVAVGMGKERVILQTFSPASLLLLEKHMPQQPKCFLLWLNEEKKTQPQDDFATAVGLLRKGNDMPLPGETKAEFTGKMEVKSVEHFKSWLLWAQQHGATITGPSAKLVGWLDPIKGEQSYADLVQPWMNDFTHERGMLIHVYAIDEVEDFSRVDSLGVDGAFSNRSDVALSWFHKIPPFNFSRFFAHYGM